LYEFKSKKCGGVGDASPCRKSGGTPSSRVPAPLHLWLAMKSIPVPLTNSGPRYCFACAAVAVDSSNVSDSSASWSRFSPASNFVNGHVSTMWFMICRWPQSQEGDWARPHVVLWALTCPETVHQRPRTTRETETRPH